MISDLFSARSVKGDSDELIDGFDIQPTNRWFILSGRTTGQVLSIGMGLIIALSGIRKQITAAKAVIKLYPVADIFGI